MERSVSIEAARARGSRTAYTSGTFSKRQTWLRNMAGLIKMFYPEKFLGYLVNFSI